MEGYDASSYGDRFADVYDDWYGDISDSTRTAEFVDSRSSGPILELGSGTGRLLAPLVARRRSVVGLDSSTGMLSRSVAAVPEAAVVRADMARAPVRSGSIGCVFVAYNTLFNVASTEGQTSVFADAARIMTRDGCLIVEAFVAVDGRGRDERVEVTHLGADRVSLRVTRTDFDAQTLSGQYVDLVHGKPVMLRPWHLRFSSPEELDAMATSCGLVLTERHGGWDERLFDDSSDVHVSVYRRR